ncbi:hypothetical protein ElyMa_004474500 [Elysia marginata]|uniref:Uncharacterized protein n=1 Tax=Elysia marginata TaxID=1093978 RepID=A0AAV4HJI4_9GAST|nr:hypothetical protein ElyMa_004474500 [Elysia marginata]
MTEQLSAHTIELSEAVSVFLVGMSKVFGKAVEDQFEDGLASLASGRKVQEDVADDLLSVERKGKELFESFVKNRLKKKTEGFHKPLQRNKTKTFSSLKKATTLKKDKNVVKVKAQRNLFGQLLVLSQEDNIDLQKVLQYPLTPTQWSLATPDGWLLKTNKATLLRKLTLENSLKFDDYAKNRNTAYIVDGNALMQSFSTIPNTFGEIAESTFSSLPQTACVHFVTDTYKEDSIKNCERLRRGSSVKNVYLLRGLSTTVPEHWKYFLCCNENKRSLIRFLLNEWESDKYATKLVNKKVFFVCEERCTLLCSDSDEFTVSTPIPYLYSSQEETDTRIILHGQYASRQPNCDTIVIRSQDIDVFLLLLAFSESIGKILTFDTGCVN